MKSWAIAAVGILTGALLAGCEVNVITQIDSSGAGTVTTEVGMTPDEVAQLESLSGETGGACSGFSAAGQVGVEPPAFEEEIRGEDTWCVSTTPFASLDELARLYEGMGFVRIRELTLREGLLVYDLELDTQGSQPMTTPMRATWVLELPGKVGSHNAESAEGRRLAWALEPSGLTEVQASSDLFAPNLPFRLGGAEAAIIAAAAGACCGMIFLVVIVLVIVLLWRRRASGDAASGK